MKTIKRLLAATLLLAATHATTWAQAPGKPTLVIGVVASASGPAAALGLPEKKAIELVEEMARSRGDLPFQPRFVYLDDGSDPTRAVNAVRKLASEDGAAVVICCTTTPASMAVLDTVKAAGVLNISMASAATVVEPVAERHWTFKTPMTDRMQIAFTLERLKKSGAKRIAYFGLEDAYGEAGWNELRKLAPEYGLQIVASERFSRADTNFTPQALRIRQAGADAVYLHAIPPSSVLAHQALLRVGVDRPVFHSAGAANAGFLAMAKGSLDGAYVVSGALQVHEQLPASHPLKQPLQRFVEAYARKFPGETADLFAGQGWDAAHLALSALSAATKAVPAGAPLPALRTAARDQMERIRGHAGANGIFNLSKDDHLGLDDVGLVMLRVDNGRFKLLGD